MSLRPYDIRTRVGIKLLFVFLWIVFFETITFCYRGLWRWCMIRWQFFLKLSITLFLTKGVDSKGKWTQTLVDPLDQGRSKWQATRAVAGEPTYNGRWEVTSIIGNTVVNSGFPKTKNCLLKDYPLFWHAPSKTFASPLTGLKNSETLEGAPN
jgi:hypothetical protein